MEKALPRTISVARGGLNCEFARDKGFTGGTWGFVDIDVTPYLGNTEKIDVTLLCNPPDRRSGRRPRAITLSGRGGDQDA